jgi:hypothetical protein
VCRVLHVCCTGNRQQHSQLRSMCEDHDFSITGGEEVGGCAGVLGLCCPKACGNQVLKSIALVTWMIS